MEKIKQFLTQSLMLLISCYRYFVSPLLGNRCRFYPSCSCYAQEALTQFGILKGLKLAVIRLGKCHPWHPGGHDPLPENEQR